MLPPVLEGTGREPRVSPTLSRDGWKVWAYFLKEEKSKLTSQQGVQHWEGKSPVCIFWNSENSPRGAHAPVWCRG